MASGLEYLSRRQADKTQRRQAKKNLRTALNKNDFRENPNQLNIQDRVIEAQIRRRVPMLPRHCLEYSKQYDIVLPSAPALRSLPRKTVDAMVTRLYPFKIVPGPNRGINGSNAKMTSAKEDVKNREKTTHRQNFFRKCSCCDSLETISVKKKHKRKNLQGVHEMVERLSVAKLHDSDFLFGKVIRFRSAGSLCTHEDDVSLISQSMRSLNSSKHYTQAGLVSQKSASLHTLPIKLPPITNRIISTKGENGLKVTVTLKKKTKSRLEKLHERLIKSSSPKRDDVQLVDRAQTLKKM